MLAALLYAVPPDPYFLLGDARARLGWGWERDWVGVGSEHYICFVQRIADSALYFAFSEHNVHGRVLRIYQSTEFCGFLVHAQTVDARLSFFLSAPPPRARFVWPRPTKELRMSGSLNAIPLVHREPSSTIRIVSVPQCMGQASLVSPVRPWPDLFQC